MADRSPIHSAPDRTAWLDGYEYGADGYGVPSTAVDAVLKKWAGLDADHMIATQSGTPIAPSDLLKWAGETLRSADSAHVFATRNLARLAAVAAIREAFGNGAEEAKRSPADR